MILFNKILLAEKCTFFSCIPQLVMDKCIETSDQMKTDAEYSVSFVSIQEVS